MLKNVLKGIREIRYIMKKELTAIFRDRVTFIMLAAEIAAIPLFMATMNSIFKGDSEKVRICATSEVMNDPAWQDFEDHQKELTLSVTGISENVLPETLFQSSDDCDIVLFSSEKGLAFIYDTNSYNSYETCKKVYQAYQTFCLDKILGDHLLNRSVMTDENGLPGNERSLGLAAILPIMLMMIACQGTMELAGSMIAGEKEKGTLELLLLNCNRRENIFWGKLAVLLAFNTISVVSGLLSLYLSASVFHYYEVNIHYLLLFAALFLTSVIISMAAMIISMKAHSYRSAQLLIGILVSVPSGIIALLAYGVPAKVTRIAVKVPVLNMIQTTLEITRGECHTGHLLYSVISTVALIVMMGNCVSRSVRTGSRQKSCQTVREPITL